MKKILLFAFAISLGSIAFALNGVDCSVEENCHCGFFSQQQFYGIKGCSSCPVRENGHYLKCETLAQNGGVIDRDCCWLNTPQRPETHPWSNCYTNAYVILDPSYGPPWAVRCVGLLDSLVASGANGGTGGSTGGTNGSNGNTNNNVKKVTGNNNSGKINPVNRPAHVAKPSRPVVSGKSEKQTPVQPSSKKPAK